MSTPTDTHTCTHAGAHGACMCTHAHTLCMNTRTHTELPCLTSLRSQGHILEAAPSQATSGLLMRLFSRSHRPCSSQEADLTATVSPLHAKLVSSLCPSCSPTWVEAERCPGSIFHLEFCVVLGWEPGERGPAGHLFPVGL